MKYNKIILTAMLCLSAVFVTSCGGKDIGDASIADTTTTTTTTTTTKVTTTAAPEEEPAEVLNFNNLTGENDVSDEAVGKRPVAIMINNITDALPQYGIYGADIMIECPVEGGITRMMAVFDDYTAVPDVCSVRSCRYYYALFASSFDCVYLHCGIDHKIAEKTLEENSIDHIDGGYNTTLFKHDEERMQNYSIEHTVYCDGSLIPEQIENEGIRTDIADDYNVPVFDFYDKATKVSDEKCTEYTIDFSNYYYSTFTYDKKTNTYKKQHNGEKHMDTAVNKQLEYTNVFALKSKKIEVVNQKNGLLSLDWTGGTGYYISNGTKVEIKWSKASEKAPLVFTDMDGNPLKVNKGNSYIGVYN